MFITDTSGDPSAVKQISSIIERYNLLVNDIKSIEDLQKIKDDELKQLNNTMNNELLLLRARVSEIKELVDKTTKYKIFVGREFKQIIKSDSFNRLSRRVDNLNFENRMSRDEFYKALER
jgi:archaellum component FlaC